MYKNQQQTLTSSFHLEFETELLSNWHDLKWTSAGLTSSSSYCQQVEFIEELPKTVSGKVKRNELRKKEWITPWTHATNHLYIYAHSVYESAGTIGYVGRLL